MPHANMQPLTRRLHSITSSGMQLKLFLHFLVVLGNFKAWLGPDDALFTHNSVSNDSGKLMLEIMEDYDMLATNTLFRKKKGSYGRGIHRKTRHTKSIISWLTENGKSVLNSEPYGSFSSLGSDHRVATATIRLSLPASQRRVERKAKYTWNEVTTKT